MVILTATKKIDIHRILAVATLTIKEKRPDIVWLLQNIGQWGFSEGENQNLNHFINALRNDHPFARVLNIRQSDLPFTGNFERFQILH